MPQRKFFVATEILVFDFELFIGDRCETRKGRQLSRAALSFTGRFVSFRVAYFARGLFDCLRSYSPVVDAHVVDQAGEETCRIEGLAGADMQAAIRVFQRIQSRCIFGNFDTIYV